MGFEIENSFSETYSGNTIPTSSMKIGTVTFIKPESKEFVALGHSTLQDADGKLAIRGLCYDIEFAGINKGTTETTGNIVAMLDRNNQLGYIYYDTNYGVFGRVDSIEEDYEEVDTACWYNVRKGEANIIMALNDDELTSYDVEIIEINYINSNKNIKVKITDDKLLERTGGVVQGMSGTPLMQNGKLIGAINYVSSEDPSIAYAIFIDKLV